MGLNIQEQDVNGVKVLRLEGRLDAISSNLLEKKMEELLHHTKPSCVLDFTKIDYLSSAGMRLLLSMTKKMKHQEGMLAICAVHDDVMEIIRMAGFERILAIYPLEKEAITAVVSQRN